MLYLNEDESFSLQANITNPGYQRMVLKGYLVSKRSDGTYVAPLIPQLFYGVSGTQLQTWRQDIPTAGSQVIISRAAGGYPKVPRQDLYWRKASDFEEGEEVEKLVEPQLQDGGWTTANIFLAGFSICAVIGIAVYGFTRWRK